MYLPRYLVCVYELACTENAHRLAELHAYAELMRTNVS